MQDVETRGFDESLDEKVDQVTNAASKDWIAITLNWQMTDAGRDDGQSADPCPTVDTSHASDGSPQPMQVREWEPAGCRPILKFDMTGYNAATGRYVGDSTVVVGSSSARSASYAINHQRKDGG